MAHFAELDNQNIVKRVIVISDEYANEPSPDNEQSGINYILETLQLGGVWKQCSYNADFRAAYPGPGWTYDPIDDVFVAPPVEEDATE